MPTQTHTLAIHGMTCQACATRLEKVLNKKECVERADVNFATETLTLSTTGDASDDEILTWIKKTGFTGEFIQNQSQTTPHSDTPPYRLITLGVLSLPFWVGMAGMMTGSHALMPPNWVQFILASIAQFALAVPFYKGAWAGIRRGGLLGMDVLVALGTSMIWAYSTYAWLAGGHVYFEASVMILTFVSLGKYLEHRTKTGSLNALSKLMELLPQTVKVKRDNAWTDVALSDVKVGDILQAKHGDKIAVDGVITYGQGDITQAHLTGESAYLSKTYGDDVLAGSVVVDGSFAYQAKATGSQTALGQMTDALSHAQGTKAPIARLADRVAGVFVPVVVGLSVLTLLANWYFLGQFDTALMRAVAVLVIACPCALGLATPTAIMAGMGVAGRHGVQFLDAVALETAGQIGAIAFDKTGTLTNGHLVVVDTLSLTDTPTLLGVSASIESHSTHPLARAITAYAHDNHAPTLTAQNILSQAGQGIQGDITGVGVVKVGTSRFVHADLGEKEHAFIQANPTASLVFVAVDDKLAGIFALADTLKADAHTLIDKLKADGITPVILSGDRQSVVDSVAGELGIDGYGELSPQDKSLKIKELQKTHKTAMIGDGINDALAMTTADIGMAVGGATDVATGSASVRLIQSDTGGAMSVYHAHKIAKLTLTNIKQNLFFAFIYNIIGIPLAMIGVLNPMIASIAMALSSLSVLANALRLKGVDLKGKIN
ncbi:cation-translocating P-type ATPase [Moraxella sp. K127]|uniref:heavy metal translocating P-type ATPase n=1 Tax=Moraxella sp. K127 TaxID=2780079 RepID=UPI00187FE639|nr:cation-translocating P-type ATPase [Moraxella sp. K127]MBE9590421.1 cation-translocating P-type ATPase [Moraxella sp. K127]